MGKKDKEENKPIIDKLGDILDKLAPDLRELLSNEPSRPKPRD